MNSYSFNELVKEDKLKSIFILNYLLLIKT